MPQKLSALHGHRYLTIYPRPGIPSCAVIPCVHLNGNHVRAIKLYIRRCIHTERHIAVIPLTGKLPVDINLWKRHNAVEIKVHTAPAVGAITIFIRVFIVLSPFVIYFAFRRSLSVLIISLINSFSANTVRAVREPPLQFLVCRGMAR